MKNPRNPFNLRCSPIYVWCILIQPTSPWHSKNPQKNSLTQVQSHFIHAKIPVWLPMMFWLVVGPPLWKIWKSIGMISNPIDGTIKKATKPPVLRFGLSFHDLYHPLYSLSSFMKKTVWLPMMLIFPQELLWPAFCADLRPPRGSDDLSSAPLCRTQSWPWDHREIVGEIWHFS